MSDWKTGIGEMERQWGGLDVCMNIAGYLMPKKIQDATDADIDRHVDVMLKVPSKRACLCVVP